MTTMTICVDDFEEALIRKHARLEGKSVSDFIRDAVIERIEDEEDAEALREAIAEDDGIRYTHKQVLAELGL